MDEPQLEELESQLDVESFRADLARMGQPVVLVPLEVDRHIRSQARKTFKRGKTHLFWAIAASILVTCCLIFTNPKKPPGLAADLNGDGVVDILDAMIMASSPPQKESNRLIDLNKNGVIDHWDGDALARRIVALKQ